MQGQASRSGRQGAMQGQAPRAARTGASNSMAPPHQTVQKLLQGALSSQKGSKTSAGTSPRKQRIQEKTGGSLGFSRKATGAVPAPPPPQSGAGKTQHRGNARGRPGGKQPQASLNPTVSADSQRAVAGTDGGQGVVIPPLKLGNVRRPSDGNVSSKQNGSLTQSAANPKLPVPNTSRDNGQSVSGLEPLPATLTARAEQALAGAGASQPGAGSNRRPSPTTGVRLPALDLEASRQEQRSRSHSRSSSRGQSRENGSRAEQHTAQRTESDVSLDSHGPSTQRSSQPTARPVPPPGDGSSQIPKRRAQPSQADAEGEGSSSQARTENHPSSPSSGLVIVSSPARIHRGSAASHSSKKSHSPGKVSSKLTDGLPGTSNAHGRSGSTAGSSLGGLDTPSSPSGRSASVVDNKGKLAPARDSSESSSRDSSRKDGRRATGLSISSAISSGTYGPERDGVKMTSLQPAPPPQSKSNSTSRVTPRHTLPKLSPADERSAFVGGEITTETLGAERTGRKKLKRRDRDPYALLQELTKRRSLVIGAMRQAGVHFSSWIKDGDGNDLQIFCTEHAIFIKVHGDRYMLPTKVPRGPPAVTCVADELAELWPHVQDKVENNWWKL